jgi:hypothetical protein
MRYLSLIPSMIDFWLTYGLRPGAIEYAKIVVSMRQPSVYLTLDVGDDIYPG